MAAYRIVKLNDSWKGKTRLFRYWTDSYLDIQIITEQGGKPDRIPEKDV